MRRPECDVSCAHECMCDTRPIRADADTYSRWCADGYTDTSSDQCSESYCVDAWVLVASTAHESAPRLGSRTHHTIQPSGLTCPSRNAATTGTGTARRQESSDRHHMGAARDTRLSLGNLTGEFIGSSGGIASTCRTDRQPAHGSTYGLAESAGLAERVPNVHELDALDEVTTAVHRYHPNTKSQSAAAATYSVSCAVCARVRYRWHVSAFDRYQITMPMMPMPAIAPITALIAHPTSAHHRGRGGGASAYL